MCLVESNTGSDNEPSLIKAIRLMKFSLKNGENSAGIDLANTKCEYFIIDRMNLVFIGKPGSLKSWPSL